MKDEELLKIAFDFIRSFNDYTSYKASKVELRSRLNHFDKDLVESEINKYYQIVGSEIRFNPEGDRIRLSKNFGVYIAERKIRTESEKMQYNLTSAQYGLLLKQIKDYNLLKIIAIIGAITGIISLIITLFKK